MHPFSDIEIGRMKMEDDLRFANRERLAQAARKDRPRSIDFSKLGERLRERLFGGPAVGGRPAAGAAA